MEDKDQDHLARGVNARGLSDSKREIIILCEKRRASNPKRVIEEFNRLANSARAPSESTELVCAALVLEFYTV